MSKDIRIASSFPNHPKTLKLISRLGHKGIFSLISLWAFVGEYRPKGILSDMTNEDIAISSKWGGSWDEWVNNLIDLRWVDRGDEWLEIHDWKEHNRFAYYAPERSAQAQKAALAKWGKTKGKSSKKKKSPVATIKTTWLTPYAEIWKGEMGGDLPFGIAGKSLKVVEEQMGRENSLIAFANYCREIEPKYSSVVKFAQTAESWLKKSTKVTGQSATKHLSRDKWEQEG